MFLARHYGVRVIAVDLWTPAGVSERAVHGARLPRPDRAAPPGCHGRPAVRRRLFRRDLQHELVQLLRRQRRIPGDASCATCAADGILCVGGEVLTDEFTEEQLRNPPHAYAFRMPPPNEGVDVFEDDFQTPAHPGLVARSVRALRPARRPGLPRSLADAEALYEDMVLFEHEHGIDPFDVAICLEQIEWGRGNRPAKSLFTITARRTGPRMSADGRGSNYSAIAGHPEREPGQARRSRRMRSEHDTRPHPSTTQRERMRCSAQDA